MLNKIAAPNAVKVFYYFLKPDLNPLLEIDILEVKTVRFVLFKLV